MPIYEYRCDKGHEVEVIQSITEDSLEKCPECGAPTRRVLHSPAIHFKGPGFHNTDYGKKTRNKVGEGGDPPGSGGDSGSSAKESKSDGASSDSGSSSSDGGSSPDKGSAGKTD